MDAAAGRTAPRSSRSRNHARAARRPAGNARHRTWPGTAQVIPPPLLPPIEASTVSAARAAGGERWLPVRGRRVRFAQRPVGWLGGMVTSSAPRACLSPAGCLPAAVRAPATRARGRRSGWDGSAHAWWVRVRRSMDVPEHDSLQVVWAREGRHAYNTVADVTSQR
jgi:hypothetical protein